MSGRAYRASRPYRTPVSVSRQVRVSSSNYWRYQMKDTPVLGDALKAYDQNRFWNDYLHNIGKDWDFVRYPSLLGGTTYVGAGMSAMSSVAGVMISRNLMRMYR